jgi:hypothetical protein
MYAMLTMLCDNCLPSPRPHPTQSLNLYQALNLGGRDQAKRTPKVRLDCQALGNFIDELEA